MVESHNDVSTEAKEIKLLGGSTKQQLRSNNSLRRLSTCNSDLLNVQIRDNVIIICSYSYQSKPHV
jgi:hypothetical protein